MSVEDLVAHKESLKDVLVSLGNPASRHLALARTSLEDAVLRLDCEIRSEKPELATPSDKPALPEHKILQKPLPEVSVRHLPSSEIKYLLKMIKDLEISEEEFEKELQKVKKKRKKIPVAKPASEPELEEEDDDEDDEDDEDEMLDDLV